MKNQTYLFSALTLGTALILSGCASDPQSTVTPSATQQTEPSGHSTHSSSSANEADMVFAAGMKQHHEQAIEMSDMILGKEDIPQEVTALAERIKEAQAPEIERMDSWLAEWDMPEGMDHGSMQHEGMVPQDDIKALQEASGKEAAQLFLEQMIMHHEGAVDMSESEVEDGKNAEAKELAGQIIESQTAEINEMKQLLAGL